MSHQYPQQQNWQPQQQPPRKRRKAWPWVLGTVAAVALVALVGIAVVVRQAASTSGNNAAPLPSTLAQPNPALQDGPTQPASPDTTERGLIHKDIGEVAGITDGTTGEDVVLFTVETIEVNPACSAQYSMAPENGTFIALRINIETTPEYNPAMHWFAPNPAEFTVQGADGFTHQVNSAAAYGCVAMSEQLPPGNLTPASNYVGTVVLDSPITEGIIMFRPSMMLASSGGWEWDIPA